MKKFRVDVISTIDVDANDETQAEVMALEALAIPGASVAQVTEISNEKQPELFDE